MSYEISPKNVRDLRMMYETCGYIDGCIDFEMLKPFKECKEGDFNEMLLTVTPDTRTDTVTVKVYRNKITNLDGNSYSPRRVTDWSKSYDFEGFRESPFYDMTIEKWSYSKYREHPLYWDTHLMDDRRLEDEGDRWTIDVHVYEHSKGLFNSWNRTGRIVTAGAQIDEDGGVELCLDNSYIYSGDMWELAKIVREHKEMHDTLSKLKEHGIDVDGGTLSIKLWEED